MTEPGSTAREEHHPNEHLPDLGEAELSSRRSFFQITDGDLARLAALRPFAKRHTTSIVEEFYELLLSHPDTKTFFPDEATVVRVKRTQTAYFAGLFTTKLDLAYVKERLRVGVAHHRIGLAPHFYLGAYRRYLELIFDHMLRDAEAVQDLRANFLAVQKIVHFDVSLAIDTYIGAHLETIARHQQAIRDLSTPVIGVHEGVLLLPLIGTLDDDRAQQVMETVLLNVVKEKARCIIIDVAGVPIVDTRVAGHLVRTTAAVRLLGADVLVTGIAPRVATTIVQLGVDVSSMRTAGHLAEGIRLALGMIGKEIRDAEQV
jgi:rsbT co-antagonist protein RsbR